VAGVFVQIAETTKDHKASGNGFVTFIGNIQKLRAFFQAAGLHI
jgi:hypothetical protein